MSGLEYKSFMYRGSRVHLASINLHKRELRPVMQEGTEAFPIQRNMPIYTAIDQGALLAGVSAFNLTLWGGVGIADQPLNHFAIDKEIWTQARQPGWGFAIGKHMAWCDRNVKSLVKIWRVDHSSFEVEKINGGHDGRIVAFTARGGTNEYPKEGKHYVRLGKPGPWVAGSVVTSRDMTVLEVSIFDPLYPVGDEVVLEAPWPLKLKVNDVVSWAQRLGGEGVQHLVSGLTGVLKDGQNLITLANLNPVPSHGPDNWLVRVNPRAFLGVSQDGRTAFMVIVEGRIPESKGMRLKQAGTMMLQHGVWNATQMDGGGSAFMWIKGRGLVADSCYGDGTIEGLRPDHYVMGVF